MPAEDLLRIVDGNTRSEIAANKPQIQPPTRSPLLARMAAFLPTMQAANADLEHVAPSSDAFTLEEQKVCSEHSGSLIRSQGSSDVDSDDENSRGDVLKDACLGDAGPRIEMNLTCGLLDLKDGAACSAAEATMQNGCSIEDALGNSVKMAALDQSPKLFVDGAPIAMPPASDSHRATVAVHTGATYCDAVEDTRCSVVEQVSGSRASCVETRCDDGSVAKASKAKKDSPSCVETGGCDVPGDGAGEQHLGGSSTSACNQSVWGTKEKRAKIEVLSSFDL